MARIVIEAQSKGISKTKKEVKQLGEQGAKTDKQFQSFGKNASAAVAAIDGPLGGISSRVSSLTTLLSSGNIAIAGMAAAVAALAFAAAQGVKVLDEYEVNLKRTEALLTATGYAAGFTADQLQKQAEQLALNTLTGVSNVQKAQAALLTFNKVSGDVFKNAIELSQDLAESGFGSIETNAVQLGKALQDPATGISALTRVGVTFNETQKETIKLAQDAGDTFAAQQVIVKALQEQVGGAGAAVAEGSLAGKLDTAGQFWDNFTKALASESGAFTVAKNAVDILNASLQALTQSIEGPSLADQLSGAEQAYEQINKQIAEQEKELSKLEATKERGFSYLTGELNISSKVAEQKRNLLALEEQREKQLERVNELSAKQAEITAKEDAAAQASEGKKKEAEEQAAKDRQERRDAEAQKEAEALQKQEQAQQNSINKQVEALQNRFLSEEEILQQRIELIKQSDLDILDQLELQEQLETEIRNRKIDAEIAGFEEIQKAKSQAAKDAAKMTAEEERSERERVSLLMSATGMIASALDERSTAYKVAATAQAIASTYATAQEVFRGFNEAFPQPYGMIAGGAAAGAAVGIGLANVAEINKSRAQGGMVSRGDNVLVGERSPEIFVPNTDGRILNKQQVESQMGSSSGVNVIINNNTTSNVSAEQGDDGNVYVRVGELDSLVGSTLSNPNSESFRGLQSVARLERS